jgi:secreted trypsin-like serine protease
MIPPEGDKMKAFLNICGFFAIGFLLISCAPNFKKSNVQDVSDNSNIVNGSPVSANDPIGKSTVALYIPAPTTEDANAIHNFCTGTLIAPKVVMTAGHCIADFAYDEKITVDELRKRILVSFGLPVVKNINAGGVEFRTIQSAIVHPEYIVDTPSTPAQFEKPDITLLILNSPAPATSVIAKLVSDGEILQSGLKIILAGFGKIDGVNKIPATQLMQTMVTVDKAYYSKTQFTYKVIGGKSSCRGDSGGPAYLINNESQASVIGVTS